MNSLMRWEPFREMEDLVRQFRPWGERAMDASTYEWRPAANVSRLDHEYLIKADLPEVKREDVKITLQDGVLTIAGERKLEKQAKEEDRLRTESFYGRFERSFDLPEDIDEKAIKAESKDGVLWVHLPRKKGAPEATQITVQGQ